MATELPRISYTPGLTDQYTLRLQHDATHTGGLSFLHRHKLVDGVVPHHGRDPARAVQQRHARHVLEQVPGVVVALGQTVHGHQWRQVVDVVVLDRARKVPARNQDQGDASRHTHIHNSAAWD